MSLRHGSQQVTYSTYRGFGNRDIRPFQLAEINWAKSGKWIAAAGVVGVVIYFSNQDEAPYSHRKRLMIVSKDIEKYVGEQGYRETMAQFGRYLLPESHPDVVRVKRIMSRIINVSGLQDLDWKIHVIDDHKSPPNAFVLPGGKVFVFRSILPICGDDDGLATVLSHETGHQVARHTAENLSKTPIYLLVGLLLYTITGSADLNRVLISSLLQLPASREMEREADYVGLMMMSKACFDPREAVHVWERMAKYEQQMSRSGGGSIPEFLSTHPTSKHRIDLIKGWLPEAERQREMAGCGAISDSAFDGWWKTV